jgi:hypothetical protein
MNFIFSSGHKYFSVWSPNEPVEKLGSKWFAEWGRIVFNAASDLAPRFICSVSSLFLCCSRPAAPLLCQNQLYCQTVLVFPCWSRKLRPVSRHFFQVMDYAEQIPLDVHLLLASQGRSRPMMWQMLAETFKLSIAGSYFLDYMGKCLLDDYQVCSWLF